jgi:hypothetical protein
MTSRREQQGKVSLEQVDLMNKPGSASLHRTERIAWPEHDRKDRTAQTGQPRLDSLKRTDNWDRSVIKGLPVKGILKVNLDDKQNIKEKLSSSLMITRNMKEKLSPSQVISSIGVILLDDNIRKNPRFCTLSHGLFLTCRGKIGLVFCVCHYLYIQ